jgi:PKD repeat protein
MKILVRCRIALIAPLAMFALLAPSAAAVVTHQPNGRFLSVAPRRGVPAASIAGSVAAQHAAVPLSSNGNLDYHSGPVMRSSAPYLIFWEPAGEAIGAATKSVLESYFADVAADSGKSSDVYGVDRQFTDGAGFADYKQQFSSAQVIVDTQPYPTSNNCSSTSASYPTCLTDAQLTSEIARLVAVNGLPTAGASSASELGQNAPIYFVVLPADVNECSATANCADNKFCAYHSAFTDGGSRVLYASIPTLDAALSPKACQADGNAAVQAPNGDQVGDVTLKYLSHEDSETITDPLGSGWWNSASGFEDGDNCNVSGAFNPNGGTNPNAFTPTLGGSAAAGTLYNQSINSDRYYIQSEWSNGDVNCQLRPSAGTISASFSASAGPVTGSPVSFDPGASNSSNGYSSVSWDFGDGATSFDNSGSGPGAVSHTYSAAGSYTVTLTIVDPKGRLSRASHQVTVTGGTTPPPPPGGGGAPPPTGTGGTPAPPVGSVPAPQQTDEPPTAAYVVKTLHRGTGQPVSFDASRSSDSDGSIVAYAWNFGDGSVGSGTNATHAFKRPGTYTVTLGITDSSGLTASTFQTVTVFKAKVTGFAVRNKTKNGATILVTVNAPGKLFGVGRPVKVTQAGVAKLRLKLSSAQHGTLASGGKMKLQLKIRFVPSTGTASTRTLTVRF